MVLMLEFADFCHYLYNEEGMSKTANSMYKSYFTQVTCYLKKNNSEFSISAVNDYIDKVRNTPTQYDKPPSSSTVNNHIKLLKRMSSWLFKRKCIDSDFMSTWKLGRATTAAPFVLEIEDQKRFLTEAYRQNYRMGVLTETLFRTGLRNKDIRIVCWRDLHGDLLTVVSKNSKRRYVTLPKDLVEKILTLRNPNFKHEYIFSGIRGQITRNYINDFIKVIAKALNMSYDIEKLTAHKFRHTYATTQAMNGVSLPVLKEELGHNDIRTTMTYVHTTLEARRKAARQHPLSNSDIKDEDFLQIMRDTLDKFKGTDKAHIAKELEKRMIELI